MPSRTFNSDRSSLLAVTGSTELGGGADTHLPVGGPYSGYTFRGVVRFALDWSSVRRINSAKLHVRTSSQVHVAFSSAPDIYVRRATTSWSPNNSSGSSDGGGGWSTSPVVYPGPSTTTSGQAQKRMPTAQSTWTDIDITAIVRAWAPATVEGGGAAANYGVVLLGVASGDITEVQSDESTYSPYIVLDYATDSPPTTVVAGPTGVVTTPRPTISGTSTDPDGDPIQDVYIEVLQGSTVVHTANLGAVPGAWSYVPTVDLPSGALTARALATAAGVVQVGWSNSVAFTVDRPPVMGAWSAPAASVSGTRRPVHTIAWSDPDGNAGEVYDIEIYPASGGVPVAGAPPAYARASQTAGLVAGSISHTPQADLPGGALVARVRVRTLGVWSDWSTYRAYTVVLTVPIITWNWPETDGAFCRCSVSELTNPAIALDNVLVYGIDVAYSAPSGTTISTTNVKIEVADVAGIGGPAVGTVLANGSIGTGGTYRYQFRPLATAAGWLAGTLKATLTITAANGGQTIEVRHFRFALGEWYGAVALGDQVTSLAATETPKLDDVGFMYRAQTSPTAANGAAAWQSRSNMSTVLGGLPATNAYLGLRSRLFRRANDPDLMGGIGSFEDSTLAGWQIGGSGNPVPLVKSIAFGGAPDGSRVLRITGDGVSSYPQVSQYFPVIPGATYTLSGWLRLVSGPEIDVRADAFLGSTEVASFVMRLIKTTTGSPFVFSTSTYTVPATGVDSLRILVYLAADPSPATADATFDAIKLIGMGVGDSGFDRLDLSWTSLG